MGKCNKEVYQVSHSLLFFIINLPNVVTSTVKLFADDTKCYRNMKDISDEILLQEYLNKLHQWSVKWQLKFNEKCSDALGLKKLKS